MREIGTACVAARWRGRAGARTVGAGRPRLAAAMYATCLHCHAALGTNDAVAAMPVGRRLAYDATRGRLWVVCPRCARWNLTPLEERWEAIEDAERLFRGTRLRAGSEEIGLARSAGLELVRVGRAPGAALAAWRYGRALEQRWRAVQFPTFAAFSAMGVAHALVGASTAPAGALAAAAGLTVAAGSYAAWRLRQLWAPRVALPDGVRRLRGRDVQAAALAPDGDGWAVTLPDRGAVARLTGADAERALRTLAASANGRGARGTAVGRAVALLDEAGSSVRFLSALARATDRSGLGALGTLPTDVALALEMALHEDAERRAMDGELAALADEWRRAEEIAAIADDLLVPAAVRARLHDGRTDAPPRRGLDAQAGS